MTSEGQIYRNGQYSARFCDERHRILEEEVNRRFNEVESKAKEAKEIAQSMQRILIGTLISATGSLAGVVILLIIQFGTGA